MSLNKALSEVKIVVGASYPSNYYWSNRIYEITGRGGFILHPETFGLDEEFTDGVHYVSYRRNNFTQLQNKIQYYLENDEEREQIREAGYRHCSQNLTYTHRVQSLLTTIQNGVANADLSRS